MAWRALARDRSLCSRKIFGNCEDDWVIYEFRHRRDQRKSLTVDREKRRERSRGPAAVGQFVSGPAPEARVPPESGALRPGKLFPVTLPPEGESKQVPV